MIRILFIDDDEEAHHVLRILLPRDFTLISSQLGRRGIELSQTAGPDLVLLDLDLPDLHGLEVLEKISSVPAAPPVIVLTGYSEVPLAVRAMKIGADDFIEKPFDRSVLLDAINSVVRNRLERPQSETDNGLLSRVIGESQKIEAVRKLLPLFAATDRPVLITGESGTGKDLVARLIHDLSPRNMGPFVARNTAAIPPNLFESELFGSERGAFTDAVTRPGYFELASAGTLFLDEIAEAPPSAQAKLLRVIEESQVYRVGGRNPIRTNSRVVSATNIDLSKALQAGTFRRDLYYRISTLLVHIPPLRDRSEDVPILARAVLKRSGNTCSFTAGALDKLCAHHWPGNVRELINVIERAQLLSRGETIDAEAILLG